jgi:hypothetical protein
VVGKEIFFLFKFVGILGCLCQQQQQPQSMPTLSRRGRLELFGSPFRQPHGKGAAMAEVFERNSTTTADTAATLSFFSLVGWLVGSSRARESESLPSAIFPFSDKCGSVENQKKQIKIKKRTQFFFFFPIFPVPSAMIP